MKKFGWLVALALLLLITTVPSASAASDDPVGARGLTSHVGPALDGSCSRLLMCNQRPALNGEAYVNSAKLWQTNFTDRKLELLDLVTCQVIKECPAPRPVAPSELTMYKGWLVEYDFGSGMLTAIDTTDCSIVWSINCPGDDLAEGLASDGEFLYKGDSAGIHQFAVDELGNVTPGGFCANVPGDSYDGLAFCKNNGMTIIALGYSGVLYQIDFNSCHVLGSCQLNLGADGNGVASNFVDHVYIDSVSGTVDETNVGCSLPPVPVEPTTWSQLKARY